MLAMKAIGFDPEVTRCPSVLFITLSWRLAHRIHPTAQHGSTLVENLLLLNYVFFVGMCDQSTHRAQEVPAKHSSEGDVLSVPQSSKTSYHKPRTVRMDFNRMLHVSTFLHSFFYVRSRWSSVCSLLLLVIISSEFTAGVLHWISSIVCRSLLQPTLACTVLAYTYVRQVFLVSS